LIPLGLTHKTKVKIEGLPGTYVVLDKMNKHWEKKIDIYMGNNKEAAIQWGKRKVTITWKVEAETE
jgi:3D (Asp-Asp-Asp) domain-containing protein